MVKAAQTGSSNWSVPRSFVPWSSVPWTAFTSAEHYASPRVIAPSRSSPAIFSTADRIVADQASP